MCVVADFPHQWPTLLPELVSKLASPDMAIINGVLEAANSIFKRFRNVEGTEETCIALKAALDVFAAPLLEMFTKMTAVRLVGLFAVSCCLWTPPISTV